MKRLTILLILLITAAVWPAVASADDVSDRPYVLVGSEVITPTVSTALTVPANAQWAWISVWTKAVRIEFDASTATSADFPVAAGVVIKIVGNLQLTKLRFLDTADGASTVYVKYFRAERP